MTSSLLLRLSMTGKFNENFCSDIGILISLSVYLDRRLMFHV